MNYRKSIILSAFIGTSLMSYAQNAKFDLNGLGRSVITNNSISGDLVDADESVQKKGTSGYNLFDLQTNLAVDSNFQAMAIFRARSPFGSFFGATTNFEFRQFKINGKLQNLKYEIGDIRVEMTPFTVFNPSIVAHDYESVIFKNRRAIQEYENFNLGNSWLLQGAGAEYFLPFGKEGTGLGLYAFTTRNTSTNESTVPDRLLSGGRLAFQLKKMLTVGVNAVALYDISLLSADFDYNNQVYTGDLRYVHDGDAILLDAKVEGGISNYFFSQFIDQDTIIDRTDTSYQDGFTSVDLGLALKDLKIRFDANFRTVGVVFSSPSAQSRRIDVAQNPALFGTVQSGERGQFLYDRATAEEVYNSKITPTFMPFNPIFNNSMPYGLATPNRTGGHIKVGTDTSQHNFDASAKFTYMQEVQGEGVGELRNFMVISGGGVAHLGKLFGSSRLIDLSAGVRYENTNRGGLAPVALTSTMVDGGFAVEVLKKIDLVGGIKYVTASGNEYYAIRDGFNLVSDFTALDLNATETILSGGARIRFSTTQFFSINYNYVTYATKAVAGSNYNMGQLFFNYTGTF